MGICSLLIVDDEITIRKGLIKLVEQKAPNWMVVGEARNGNEAIERIREIQPDLVLTDVRMPILDGIGVAQYVHEEQSDAKVVILTGYKDWEYAQAAIRYGVLDFLLKPCPEHELLKVLDKAYAAIVSEMERREHEQAERKLAEENAIRSIMLRLPHDQLSLKKLNEHFACKELLFMKVATYYPEAKSYVSADLNLLQFAMVNIASELIESLQLRGMLLPVVHDVYALFLEPNPAIEELTETARRTMNQLLGIEVGLHSCGILADVLQLPALYEQIASNGTGDRGDSAIPQEAVSLLPVMNQNKVRAVQDRIMTQMMLGRDKQVEGFLHDYRGELAGKEIHEAKQDALTLVLSLYVIIQKEFGEDEAALGIAEQLDELHPLERIEDVLLWTGRQEERFNLAFRKWQQNRNENIIANAVSYIDEHYGSSCSLTEVADAVHLSSNYFSNLFKREKGESFVNYVTRVRMDKAKLLLSNTTMKISEIAEAVGYDDPNYFTTVFKQLTAMSPRAYRKQAKEQP